MLTDVQRTIMKIQGVLVDMLVEIAPEVYKDFVNYNREKSKILYISMLKPLCGMMKVAILYYKQFIKDITKIDYAINPYESCIVNKMVNNEQHTSTSHVDDIKASHMNPKVNDEFEKQYENKYSSYILGYVKVTRGKIYDYLEIILNYSNTRKLKIDIRDYIRSMEKEQPCEIKIESKPWNGNLFKKDKNSKLLLEEGAKLYYHLS